MSCHVVCVLVRHTRHAVQCRPPIKENHHGTLAMQRSPLQEHARSSGDTLGENGRSPGSEVGFPTPALFIQIVPRCISNSSRGRVVKHLFSSSHAHAWRTSEYPFASSISNLHFAFADGVLLMATSSKVLPSPSSASTAVSQPLWQDLGCWSNGHVAAAVAEVT